MTTMEPGTVARLKVQGTLEAPCALQVVGDLEHMPNGKFKCQLTDGKENVASVFTSQLGREFGTTLKGNDVVRVDEANVTAINEAQVLIVAKAEVLGPAPPDATTAPPAAAEPAEEDEVMAEAGSKTPAAALKTAATAVTPAAHPTPPSAGWAKGGSASKRPLQPIGALNPYNNNWAIKAKVVSKGSKRSFSRGGAPPTGVFSAELVDAAGVTIEATFWREAADRYFDLLEEGKVYLLARGSVKPANKKYSQVRNDYCLNFDAAAEVEPCAEEIDTSSMQARMEFVPIDQLAAYVDKKMSVDVCGVVTSVGIAGTVKRKSDQAELHRRDMTLVDQSLKTVVVTLWGTSAEVTGSQIEALAADAPVLAISNCRVSSYNGVSVSSLARSVVLLNPDLPEATALRQWYDTTGRGAATTHVGEGLASALKRSGSGSAPERVTLEGAREGAPTGPDDKPTYHTVQATFAVINPEQSLYYLAHPETNRKVVEQAPGEYYCEYDQSTCASAVRRYIFLARLTDASGELGVQVFNDQGEALLRQTADEVHPAREADPTRFSRVLKDAAWTDWVVRVKAQAQQYNGEVRQRYSLAEMRPMDYASESKRLLEALTGQAVATA